MSACRTSWKVRSLAPTARPALALQLLGLVVQRLRRSTQLAYDVAFLDVPARLARVLLDMAGEGNRAPRPTQVELAALVGSSRESVNKWLGTFERLGWIRVERDAITLLRPADLRRRVG